MIIYRIRTLQEWQQHAQRMERVFLRRNIIEGAIEKNLEVPSCEGNLNGYSYPARQDVSFKILKAGNSMNWRETLVCPVTDLSNRMRSCLHAFDIECGPYIDNPIYSMEQTTPAYAYLEKSFTNVIGSEYLGDNIKSGMVLDGLRHEDVTNMSFDDGSLSHILSFDVFEHVPDYTKGFEECYRVLNAEGNILWTVPFIRQSKDNIVRATIQDDGPIEHLLEPEYHGDPVNPDGVLCYYHFGWELLSQVRQIGFKDVYACLFWSDAFGYLGSESLIFVAHK